MFDNDVFPSTWTDDYDDPDDPCDQPSGETYTFTQLFAAYDYHMRVDSDGNPHFRLGILPAD